MLKPVILSVLALPLAAADGYCPSYPSSRRAAQAWSLDLERSQRLLEKTRRERESVTSIPPIANFIDEELFGKMTADNVEPAPLADDAMFLRRVTMDLTGRIPSPEQVELFLSSSNPGKRAQAIEDLLASEAFVDQWTLYLARRFQVTTGFYWSISVRSRTLWQNYLRDFVRGDRSWKDLTTELITASGDNHESGPANVVIRNYQGEPIQDTWDNFTNTVTTQFLGVQTQCISCHDGRRHLEQINLYLTGKTRPDFMRLSAYFARMSVSLVVLSPQNYNFVRGVITDRLEGLYHGQVFPQHPGLRPARLGLYEARYLFDDRPAAGEEWRKELARQLTGDRQFARAAVNYLWAYFFRAGIVDPPDAWDLARVNPAEPLPAAWTVQPSHPRLLERLADAFIANGYRLKPLMRLITQSSAYQLSSRYPGRWRPGYSRYFARQTARRLTAEEAYDAMAAATLTRTPMNVEGVPGPLLHAGQLPDPTEPRENSEIMNLLATLGRGDWVQIPDSVESTVLQVLYLMNDPAVTRRTFGNRLNNTTSRVALLMVSPANDEAAVRELFLATIGRPPAAAEMGPILAARSGIDREVWLSDVQWALLNRAEFLFLH